MTVGAVTFDFGGAFAPAFPLPDASGLVPLSLPEGFFHRHESSLPLPQPSSDAVQRFETAMGAEPLASHLAGIKNLVAAGTVPIASEGTDPMQAVGADPVMKPVIAKKREVSGGDIPLADEVPVAPNRESLAASAVVQVKDVLVAPVREAEAGTVAQASGADPVPKGTVPMHTVGTVPKPKGTDPVQVVGTVPIASEGTDPVQVVGTVPVPRGTVPMHVEGTDPMQVAGTDPVPRLAVAKKGEVSGREVSIVPEVRVVPEVPVATEVPVAPNKESYVAPVVASVKDVPVAPVREVEVGTVAEKVSLSELESASKTVLPTEAKLSPETTKPAPEATRLAHETLVQVPETAKPIIEGAKPTIEGAKPTVEAAKPTIEVARPTLEAKPEIKLEAVPAIGKAGQEEEVVALDAKQAQPLQAIPVFVATDAGGTVDAQSATAREVSAVSAATARTEAVVEVVDKLVEAVVSQITVTPSIIRGEGEVHITLKANVLDGSNITLSAKDGALAVVVTPATPEAAQTIAVAASRLEVALAEHVPTFRNVVVKLGSVSRKGNSDETA